MRAKDNPYYSLPAGLLTVTAAAKVGNDITLSGTLKTPRAQAVAGRINIRAYFTNDANGDSIMPQYLMPSGGYKSGTNGFVIPGPMPADALMVKGGLAIHSTPEQFKTTATAIYRVAGAQYSKAAATGLTFTAAHVVTASKFAVILVQINAAGTISTKVPGSPQAYNTAALALAALPAPDAGNVALGYIAIAAKAATWTANTDDLTNGSDLTTATFVDAGENASFGPLFAVQAKADGTFNVVVTETVVGRTHRIAFIMPDSTLVVSPALTF